MATQQRMHRIARIAATLAIGASLFLSAPASTANKGMHPAVSNFQIDPDSYVCLNVHQRR